MSGYHRAATTAHSSSLLQGHLLVLCLTAFNCSTLKHLSPILHQERSGLPHALKVPTNTAQLLMQGPMAKPTTLHSGELEGNQVSGALPQVAPFTTQHRVKSKTDESLGNALISST